MPGYWEFNPNFSLCLPKSLKNTQKGTFYLKKGF